MRRIPLSSVKNGDILAQSVYDQRGRVLLRSGNRLSPFLISKIFDHNIRSVYITDSADDVGSLKDVVSPLIRLEAVNSVRDIYSRFVAKSSEEDATHGKEVLFKENPFIHNVMKAAEKLTDEVFLNPSAMVEMVSIKSYDTYIYEHAVNVAVLSLLIGLDMKLKEEDLGRLVLAALLMDLGNHFIDSDILNTPGPLTAEQWEVVRTHPERTNEFLSKKTLVPAPIRHIIQHHHERWDGSGYPIGYLGEDIPLLARIIAIADTYDSLTSDRPYRPAYPPSEALELIMGSAGRLFDFRIVDLFSKRVVAYPVGTYVMLSNGQQGEVVDINPNIPLRPIIRLRRKPGGEDVLLDLSRDLNVTIARVIYQYE